MNVGPGQGLLKVDLYIWAPPQELGVPDQRMQVSNSLQK